MCILFLEILYQHQLNLKMNDDLLNKLSKIKIVVSDVDGILTDGTIIVSKIKNLKLFMLKMLLEPGF